MSLLRRWRGVLECEYSVDLGDCFPPRYADHKYADILKGIYALMSPADRKALPAEQDPFLVSSSVSSKQ